LESPEVEDNISLDNTRTRRSGTYELESPQVNQGGEDTCGIEPSQVVETVLTDTKAAKRKRSSIEHFSPKLRKTRRSGTYDLESADRVENAADVLLSAASEQTTHTAGSEQTTHTTSSEQTTHTAGSEQTTHTAGSEQTTHTAGSESTDEWMTQLLTRINKAAADQGN